MEDIKKGKMTIKIQAYQANGIKTDKIVDEFEFCCWDSLSKWLNGYAHLHKCPKCEKENKNGKRKNI